LLNWFEKKQVGGPTASITTATGPRVLRHSGGWAMLRKRLQAEPGLRVIDVGYTSPTNINFLTELGHSVFLADLVNDAWHGERQNEKDEEGNPKWNVEAFLNQSMNFGDRTFDVVLLWTALDYLPEAFVVPVVMRFSEAINPGGQVLAFFHTRTRGDEAAHCRYHVTGGDDVQVQVAQPALIQRAFTNRSIEKLFAGWSGHRQFLAKDSVSEVIMTR
jgi:2-polyprenyl-3-methyl-5-hydroxy-6-metoxy-1,4-benzoquinol methylase